MKTEPSKTTFVTGGPSSTIVTGGAGVALPIVGTNGCMGEAIQKLFTVNTVEELIVYKSSLQAQASAVDDDVRIAIGQRYRDLLSTCEEVVGMEAVCRSVEHARQKRQRLTHLAGGASRFSASLRSNSQQIGGSLPPQVGGIHSLSLNTQPPIESSLAIIYQGLTARLGGLHVLLQRCTAPTQLLHFATRIDEQMAQLREQHQQTSLRGASMGAVSPNTNRPTAIALSPSIASPTGSNPNLFAANMDTLMAAVPPPTPAATGTSFLFCRTAMERARLLAMCEYFLQQLRKIGAPSSSSVTVSVTGGCADESSSEKQAAFALIQAVQQQLIAPLMPRTGVSPARIRSRAGDVARDVGTQLEGLVVSAIRDAYRKKQISASFQSSREEEDSHVPLPLATATQNALLMFYTDIHQALTIEEQLRGRNAEENGSPPALRALLRLIDLQERAMRQELAEVTAFGASGVVGTGSINSTKRRSAAVLGSAKNCLRGVNGLLCYLNTLLSAISASSVQCTSSTSLRRSNCALLDQASAPYHNTTEYLIGLIGSNGLRSDSNSPITAGSGLAKGGWQKSAVGKQVAPTVRGEQDVPQTDDSLLDALLVHVCGSADVGSSLDCSLSHDHIAGHHGSYSRQFSLTARVEQLAAQVLVPSPAMGDRPNTVAYLLSSLGDDPANFLHWDTCLDGSIFESTGGSPTSASQQYATPQRGGPSGEWALSPSPFVNQASSAVPTAKSGDWSVVVASALIGSGETTLGGSSVEVAIMARMKELQRSLAEVMFGTDNEPSSLLSLLLYNPPGNSISPSAAVASAKALQSLEALLLSLGSSPQIWDSSAWQRVVDEKLSTYVIGAVTAVIKCIATTALSVASAVPQLSASPAFSAAGKVPALPSCGLLACPTSSLASSIETSAVEKKILTLVMSKSINRSSAAATPPPPAQVEGSFQLDAFYQLLEALGAVLDRESQSLSSALKAAIQKYLDEELLSTLESYSTNASSTDSSPVSQMVPVIGALIASVDALTSRASESKNTSSKGDSSQVVSPSVCGVSADNAQVPNVKNANGCSKESASFISTVLRPRLVALFISGLSERWVPAMSEIFSVALSDGWRTQLLSNSSLQMFHDYEQLKQILERSANAAAIVKKAALKGKTAGKRAVERAAFITSLIEGSSLFPTNAKSLNSLAAKRFAASVQPLLWTSEVIGDSGSGQTSTVAFPRRISSNISQTLWWVQRAARVDMAALFGQHFDGLDCASPTQLASMAFELIAPSLLLALQKRTVKVARSLLEEAVSARRRADTVEAKLKPIIADAFATVEAAAGIGAVEAPAISSIPSVPSAPPPVKDDGGWGDDDDFNLDYSDDDDSAKKNEKDSIEAAPIEAAPTEQEKSSAEEVFDVEDDEKDDCAPYNEFRSPDGDMSNLQAHGICDGFYFQLVLDICFLEKSLMPVVSSPSSVMWSQQCTKLLSLSQGQVDGVHYSLALPYIRKSADEQYREGQLVWGINLGVQSLATRTWSSVSSVASPFTNSLTNASSSAPLLVLPTADIERLPLLPVTLPQASHSVALSVPSAPSFSSTSRPNGSGASANVRDDAASRLVHGATASLKSFLGGW